MKVDTWKTTMYLLFCFCDKIIMEVFDLKKGQIKRIWTKEQKLAIIKRYYEEHISAGSLAKEYEADKSMICRWIRSYNQYGESVFDSKNSRKGNPFSALHTSKSLTETDRLHLQLAKLEIENERLKKGYQVKGVGANKVFVTLKDVNMK